MELRPLRIAVLLALTAACAHESGVTVCDGLAEPRWCKHFDSLREAERYEQAEWRRTLSIARNLDIDYEKCAAVILIAEIDKSQDVEDQSVYVSIIGKDPPPSVLSQLAAAGIKAKPGSRWNEDSGFIFSVQYIERRSSGGYSARAGYDCGGTLCGGKSEYQLQKSGDSCVVESQHQLWVE